MYVQNPKNINCWNFGYILLGILARTPDQKLRLLVKEKFLQKQTLNTQMSISHLFEQVSS
jgi:hypothetical protein